MTPTLAQYIQIVLTELGEEANSNVAALPAGTGTNQYAVNNFTAVTRLLNDAKDDFCQRYYLWNTTASYTGVTAGNTTLFPLSMFTASAVTQMRRTLDTYWQPVSASLQYVQFLRPDVLRNQYPSRSTGGTGALVYWAPVVGDPKSIEIYQSPTVAGTLSVVGYGIPADMSASSDVATWLPNENYRVLVAYACAKICRQRLDDAQLLARGVSFAQEYDRYGVDVRSTYSLAMQAAFLDLPVPMAAQPITGDAQGDGSGGDKGDQ